MLTHWRTYSPVDYILTVAVLCPSGRVLDPGLDLGYPSVHSGVAGLGATVSKTDHAYLGVPETQA